METALVVLVGEPDTDPIKGGSCNLISASTSALMNVTMDKTTASQ